MLHALNEKREVCSVKKKKNQLSLFSVEMETTSNSLVNWFPAVAVSTRFPAGFHYSCLGTDLHLGGQVKAVTVTVEKQHRSVS